MFGCRSHRAIARRTNSCSRASISSRPDRLLELEDEARADRLDDRRGARFLAVLDLRVVVVLAGADVPNRAATRHVGDPVREQLSSGDQDARCARPADHLVG